MVKRYLRKPSLKTLKLKFSDILDITDRATNCVIGKQIRPALRQMLVTDFAKEIRYLCFKNHSVYVYTKNNLLIKYDEKTGQTETIAGALGESLIVEEITINGKNETLMISGGGGYVGTKSFNIPYGKYSAIHGGRCFTADNNTVSFCAPFDFSEYSYSELSGAFNTQESDGEITGLCSMGEFLYVFCQRAVYKVSLNDNSIFVLTKLPVTVSQIEHGSVKSVGGKILFLSGKKVFAFDGNSVCVVDERMEQLNLSRINGASVCGEKYAINVTVDGNYAQYVLNAVDNSVQIVSAVSSKCTDGGYMVDDTGKLYKTLLSEGDILGGAFWQSKPLYFSSPYAKNLLEISFFLKGQASLKISGDTGISEFLLVDGVNIIRLNSKSRFFTLEFTSDDCFELKEIAVKYRIIGE